ncbi:hypothetical protein Tco_0079297 [Tanacetum coccineum]
MIFRDIFFCSNFPYSEKEKCEREYKSIRQLAGESSNDFIKRFLKGLRWAPTQVANAARNIEIFRDRPKNEGDNKRDIDGHHIRPSKTPSRVDDQRDSDRYGNGGRHSNKDKYGNYKVIDRAVTDMVMVVTDSTKN